MLNITVKKLFLVIASCLTLTSGAMIREVISPDFQYVVTVDRPCTAAADSTYQVVYRMQNDGATTLPLQEVQLVPTSPRIINFPSVRTLIDLTGATLVSFDADAGTEFIDTPGFDFGRWQLTQAQGLEPGETKELTLTLQVNMSAVQTNFFVQVARNNFSISCQRQLTTLVSDTVVCPDPSTTTIRSDVGTFGRPGTITFPNTIFFDQPFEILYTLENNQTFQGVGIWDNVFPLLQDSEGRDLYTIVSVESSENSIVQTDSFFYRPGRGQGTWVTQTLQPGELAFLRLTLQPTFRATNPLEFITRVVGNPPCTVGPVQAELTDQAECVELTDPVAIALASLLPSPVLGD